MELIPVIDVRHGQVVRAALGQRARYRPIASALCPSSDPVDCARRLLAQAGGQRLYVADLDALMEGRAQPAVLAALLAAFPDLELWLDAGFRDAAAAAALSGTLRAAAARVVPVYGSESLGAAAPWSGRDPLAVLSLDRREGQAMDPGGWWGRPADWPARVIVMTLERVGSDLGPDLGTLQRLRAQAPDVRFFGAGGVRDAADLARGAAAGASGWLVASALHDRRLGPPTGAGTGIDPGAGMDPRTGTGPDRGAGAPAGNGSQGGADSRPT